MSRTTVEEIKARIPIEDLIGSYVKLEKAGKSFKAKCPFHNEKSASFFVSPERGGYYCFGCNVKGDIFSFVEQFEGLDFKGALKVLAERAGVPLVYDQKADSEKDQLFKIMEEAAAYFEEQFAKSAEAKEYVKGRGIKDETRQAFRIGWAPEGWSNLHDYLKKKGWKDVLIERAGLIKKADDSNKMYDRFRGRVMFPISDSSGRIVAFTGRILKSDDKSAKYLNSPDTPLYDKSSILFGLDKAKAEIRRLNYTIMVEGQMDLIMSYQAGVKNIVAASGTALSDEATNKQGIVSNLGLVRRLSPNVIIAFDSDAAGRKAAFRAANIALSLGMDVKMADIVGGKDPADLVKENPEIWKEILRGTKHVIEFELGSVLHEEKDARKVPRLLRERVFPLLSSIESSTDQDYFVKMIADKTGIAAAAIWDDLRATKKKLEAEAKAPSAVGRNSAPTSNKIINSTAKRNNLVERRMFGLLNLMEREGAKDPKWANEAAKYRAEIEKVAGDLFKSKNDLAQSQMDDISFESEAFFGTDKARWSVHMKEFISNFEEDLIGDQLVQAMQDLRAAEKAGDHARVAELAKRCQVLSIRKGEIVKRRI